MEKEEVVIDGSEETEVNKDLDKKEAPWWNWFVWIGALILIGEIVSNNKQYATESSTPALREFMQSDVCHVAMMSELGLGQNKIKVTGPKDSEIISLRSNSGYEYECYLEGAEVVWRAYPGGRWRLKYSAGDTKITWSASGKSILITRHHLDGSVSTNNFNFI
jgi:hypothetical protein